MTSEFDQLDLLPDLVERVAELGYTEPTPIQQAMIPIMLTGCDVIGQAQTGTGKTAAFALPILQNLEPGTGHVQCLVLTPTRELAMQVARAMEGYGQAQGVRVLAVYGGQSYSHQIRQLRQGIDIVVGTPGRLIDLIEKKVLKLDQIGTLVIDEADEMLSMGFIEDIERILVETPEARQTALFSATLPPPIRHLAQKYMRAPESVSIANQQKTSDNIEQRYYLVNAEDKLAALSRLFEVEPITHALIFVRTRVRTVEVANALTERGFRAEALSGEMSQDARTRVLERFRDKKLKLLVATDVAARGLDVDDISHVFNFDLPQEPEVYVHRIGRTGRAGKTGLALTLLLPSEKWRLRRIEAYSKQSITEASLPTEDEIWAYRDQALREKILMWLTRGRCQRERNIVAELVADGADPLEMAAVALKMSRAAEKQRPIEPIGALRQDRPGKTKPHGSRWEDSRGKKHKGGPRKQAFGNEDMVRLRLDLGEAKGIRINDVVRTLARLGGIPGSVFGKIRIYENHTNVDVPEQFVAQVLSRNGSYRIGKDSFTITKG